MHGPRDRQPSESGSDAEAVLRLRPRQEVEPLDGADRWRASRGPVEFQLEPASGDFPQDWALVTGRLSHAILDGSAAMVFHTDAGEARFDVPVSAGGRVY